MTLSIRDGKAISLVGEQHETVLLGVTHCT